MFYDHKRIFLKKKKETLLFLKKKNYILGVVVCVHFVRTSLKIIHFSLKKKVKYSRPVFNNKVLTSEKNIFNFPLFRINEKN